MFDFRKEVIINSDNLSVEDGGALRVQTTEDKTTLRVLRCADYIVSNIKNITKVAANAGTPDTAQLVAQSNPCQVVIKIGLDKHRMHGEYANDWAKLEKVLIFETASGSITDQVKALKEVVIANPIVSVSATGLITCKDNHQVIKSVEVFDEEGDLVTTIKPTGHVSPVNTGELLAENLRFPSYPNLRYAAEHAEERPIEDALYDMYSFDYVSERKGLHGQSAVGQMIKSVTTHVFYVNRTSAPKAHAVFEDLCADGDLDTAVPAAE